jgi:uncharacterized repeat protein (TIGR03803 family)
MKNRSMMSRTCQRAVTAGLALTVALLPGMLATPSAQAQTLKIIHTFTGSPNDGSLPWAGLIMDAAGNLYSTASAGGPHGNGMVFRLDTNDNETVLYTFTGGADGQFPYGGLVRDAAGNLYGTTLNGGAFGSGTVFMLNPNGKETVLHSFTGGNDGSLPLAGVIRDSHGNLYGTTQIGGDSGSGVVFELDTEGRESVLYSFTGGADGGYAWAGLLRDAEGDLYGTTLSDGAFGYGTVYKLSPPLSVCKTALCPWRETVLYSFTGGADGGAPFSALVEDAAGNLYGTTTEGGPSRNGTVFKLDPNGKETVLYSFAGGDDGSQPWAGVVMDAVGNLYGTTTGGGSSGTVFELDTKGDETVLHHFTGSPDGADPVDVLFRDPAGNLYGTTLEGGGGNCPPDNGCGTVFEVEAQAGLG